MNDPAWERGAALPEYVLLVAIAVITTLAIAAALRDSLIAKIWEIVNAINGTP